MAWRRLHCQRPLKAWRRWRRLDPVWRTAAARCPLTAAPWTTPHRPPWRCTSVVTQLCGKGERTREGVRPHRKQSLKTSATSKVHSVQWCGVEQSHSVRLVTAVSALKHSALGGSEWMSVEPTHWSCGGYRCTPALTPRPPDTSRTLFHCTPRRRSHTVHSAFFTQQPHGTPTARKPLQTNTKHAHT